MMRRRGSAKRRGVCFGNKLRHAVLIPGQNVKHICLAQVVAPVQTTGDVVDGCGLSANLSLSHPSADNVATQVIGVGCCVATKFTQ